MYCCFLKSLKLCINVYNSLWHGLCHSHWYLYNHAVDYMSQYVDWTATLVWMWIYEKCMRMGVGMICRQHGSPTSYHQAGTQTAFCSRGKWTIILHFAWEKQCKLHFAWGKQYKLHFAQERQHGNEKGFCWAASRLSKTVIFLQGGEAKMFN